MSTAQKYQIDVIAGDGIGQEVIPTAIRGVDAVRPPTTSPWSGGTGSGNRTTTSTWPDDADGWHRSAL